MPEWIHPAAILIFGSLLVPAFNGRVREGYLLLLPILAFLSVLNMTSGVYGVAEFFGQEVVFGRVDKLSLVFAYVFSGATFISMLYGLKVKEAGHHMSSLIYAGSALGVTFAGDFITLFVFWEFMAFSSAMLVFYKKEKESYEAGYRYMLVHIFGGVLLLGGIVLLFNDTGSIAFNHMEISGIGTWLILGGFLVNAAALPFNAWLPDAYPKATISGAVFMSAFTTKSAIYVLARGFSGTEMLIIFGVIMALYGVIYAILEDDIRKVQAYSIISQLGYMVVGIGIGTELAINGVAAHAFSHILYKGLLFMATGAIIYMTGKQKMTELGGLAKAMPFTFYAYMTGALAISAFPLFSGFVSKSIILASAGEEHLAYAWILLMIASSGTFLYTGLKLPYLVFMGEEKRYPGEPVPKDPPKHMLVAMGMGAALCVLLGIFPGVLYAILPYEMHYEPYTLDHIVLGLEALLFTGLGFYLFREHLVKTPGITLDTDWFYRKGGCLFMWVDKNVVAPGDDIVGNSYKTIVLKFGKALSGASYKFDVEVVDGLVNAAGKLTTGLAIVLRRFQTGLVHDYAVSVFVGLLVLLNLFFFLS